MNKYILLGLFIFLLTSCIAPDGTSYTVATVDADNRLQVQTIEVSAEQEFYRGFFNLCIYATATQNGGYIDTPGCTELVATAYAHGEHRDVEMLSLWNWEIVQVQEIK